jgi:two-component system response regulator NreC
MAVDIHLAPSPDASPTRSAGQPIRVVLADDHALMRRSLRGLLDRAPDVDVVAEARDLGAVRGQVRGRCPEVLVLDRGMPGGSGVEVIRQLRAQAPRTQIVVVTMEDNPEFANQALSAGAIGFVLKDFADTDLSATRQPALST